MLTICNSVLTFVVSFFLVYVLLADNRVGCPATTCGIEMANGDFVATGGNASYNPSYQAALGPTGRPAVVFDPRLDGIPDRLESDYNAFPNSIYGSHAWSIEMWIYHSDGFTWGTTNENRA